MTVANDFQIGYNTYEGVDETPYNCVEYLMSNNEMLWKLLKYNSPDAWSKSNLTHAEKAAMIYQGQEDATNYKVFMDIGMPDVWTHEIAVLRCSLMEMNPQNRTVGTNVVLFEFYSHYKINHLSNYKTRIDMASQQIIQTMNGIVLPGPGNIGRLHFDRMGFQNDRAYSGGQTPYKGRFIVMSSKSA